MLRRFSELAARYGLFLSGQQVLRNIVFGIDPRSCRLLVLADRGDRYEEQLIPLRSVQACTVRTRYHGIPPGALQHEELPDFLRSVELRLDLPGAPPLVLPFYEHGPDHKERAQPAVRKARLWAAAIGQLLKGGEGRPATPGAGAGAGGH
ncbi:hypothetical protein GCM10023184_07870 [Flaviaesturariibacter amylovorans]|uniref:Uncharacterized protein n=2 Tax=Flaviaesturariibacter amylovorans TaxID=1084520 RepID=A0ABP8GD35_9BACT